MGPYSLHKEGRKEGVEEGELLLTSFLNDLALGDRGLPNMPMLCVYSDSGTLEAVCYSGPASGHGYPYPHHMADCGSFTPNH